MDLITESLLKAYAKEHQIEDLAQDKQFERFVTHLIVMGQHSVTFDTEDLVIGEGKDTGIDAFAAIVNGVLVTEVDELDELAAPASNIDVTFIFIQAVRSPTFESSKMGTFGNGVVDFFAETPTLPRNQRVKDAAALMEPVRISVCGAYHEECPCPADQKP